MYSRGNGNARQSEAPREQGVGVMVGGLGQAGLDGAHHGGGRGQAGWGLNGAGQSTSSSHRNLASQEERRGHVAERLN